jgi:hypothetical protein
VALFLVVLCGFPTRTSRIPAIAAQESPESALIVVATLTVERLRILEATSLDLPDASAIGRHREGGVD